MKKLLIVANWKSNKTVREATEWLNKVLSIKYSTYAKASAGKQVLSNLEIVICPPYTLLHGFFNTKYQIPDTFKLGAQDVSPFPDGAYTGEISARMLKELDVTYVLIGHSERRKYFKEDEVMLENKVREALDVGLIPIFCIQDKTTPLPEEVKIIAYEPIFAIGSGEPDSPENANEVAKAYQERRGQETVVLYGGSVNQDNVMAFCQQANLSGVLVGGASLEPGKFSEIIHHVGKS